MNILSAAEMRACDRASTEQHGIASVDLMRHAAKAVADFTQLEFPLAKKITILCGRGNNGGDGLMAGRLLADAGLQVTTILLGDPEEMQGDAGTAYSELTNVAVIRSPEELQQHGEALNADLLLDAVLGTGFKPPMRDLPLAALHWLKSAPKLPPILAVDLPSGWNADSYEAQALDPVYPADAVITFTAPKPAHVFGLLTGSIVQPIVVSAIGSPDAAVISSLNLHWTGASKALTDKERPADSNKGMYGHVLVIGGSAGKSGAPAMASLAALRTGAGLVTAAVSPSVLPLVASVTPELMTQSLAVTDAGEIAKTNLDAGNLEKLLKGITLLAIGPGLGTSPDAVQFTIGLLGSTKLPAVVDADALNALSQHRDQIKSLAEGRVLIMTPHPGEMGRLTGLGTKAVQADRLKIAREFATAHQVHLVLKGWRTLVAHPDGTIAINTTGNPGMAKGGSGDLLTGMVAAMVAQYPNAVKEAIEAAVFLHGLAADIAVQAPGIAGDQHTLLATDLLHHLAAAFHFHPAAHKGYGWLQGLPSGKIST